MILITHIVIALSSIIVSTALAFWPSQRKLYTSIALISATLISGTYLVVTLHSSLLHVCIEGLVYLGVASSGVVVGWRRLAAQTAHIDR